MSAKSFSDDESRVAYRRWDWSKFTFERDIGTEFVGDSFDNFSTNPTYDSSMGSEKIKEHQEQLSKFLAAGKKYAKEVDRVIRGSIGILFFGSTGTGKDHMVYSIANSAIESGYTVKVVTGGKLKSHRISLFSNNDTTVQEASEEYCVDDFLWIRDPITPEGKLGEIEKDFLHYIIDRRYSNGLPIWMTVNADNAEFLKTYLGAATVSRLKHNSLTFFARWKDYREGLTAEEFLNM